MGLLDGFLGESWDDPRTQAILAMSGALSSGQGFGAGLLGANEAVAKASERKRRGLLDSMTMEESRLRLDRAKRDDTREQGLNSLMGQYFSPGSAGRPGTGDVNSALPADFRIGAQAPIAGAAPQFDVSGYTAAALNRGLMNPLDAIKLQQAMQKDTQINKLDAKDFTPASVQRFRQTGDYSVLERLDKLHFADTGGGIAGLNPFTGAKVGGVEKTGDPYKDLILNNGAGGMTPNRPLIDAKSAVAKAGAAKTDIHVNTEKSLLNEIAGGLGKGITTGQDQARGALGTISTVNRLMDALDSGKTMAGPGTTFRQFGLQVGDMLGVTGKDAKEKLLNTRQAVQSLAQLELDAAQQMKGQGQITEAERAIIRRAASGDIDGMTGSELRLLGGVLDRTARTKIKTYNQQVAPLKSNPNAAPLAPFLDVQEPEQRKAPGVMRFDAQGNLVTE